MLNEGCDLEAFAFYGKEGWDGKKFEGYVLGREGCDL